MTYTYTARFIPQAWIGDIAVEIDASGPIRWDCTEAFTKLDLDYSDRLIAELDDSHIAGWDDDVLDVDDRMKDDPNAPEWVREHRGPFDIYIARETRAVDVDLVVATLQDSLARVKARQGEMSFDKGLAEGYQEAIDLLTGA